jgi:hypothetical protein
MVKGGGGSKRRKFFHGTGNSPVLNEIPKSSAALWEVRVSKHTKAKKPKIRRDKRKPPP